MSDKKKALMLASVASMIDQFNLPNIELLNNLGYSVDVAANFTNPGNISEEKATYLKDSLESKGINVIDVPIPRSINLIDIITAYKTIYNRINNEHYNLLHCHSPIGGAIARIASKRERKKGMVVIYTAHGFHFYSGAPLKNWAVFYPIEKWLSKYTDVLITINKEDYSRAKKNFFAKKTIYVPGIGIDAQMLSNYCNKKSIRKEFSVPDETKVLLSVGELNRNKNHEAVIRALAKINTDYVYIIVGKGPLNNYLHDLAKELGIEDKVIITGFRDDVKDFYATADLFVFPSFREGLSVSLMEAMASGLPVICSKIRGNVDLIDEYKGGILFHPNSVHEIEDALERFLSDGGDCKKYGLYNKEKIRDFDCNRVLSIMTNIYQGKV